MDITVILATHNRSPLLRQTLESLAKLETSTFLWELIVVDNASTDATASVLQSFAGRLPLRPIEEPRPGKVLALNRALPLARGDTVVFTDDDVVPVREWLSSITGAVRRWPDDRIFGGRIVPLFPPDSPAWLRHHQYADAAFARFMPDQPEGPIQRTPFGPNYALRASLLEGLRFATAFGPSGSESVLGDETELLLRLVRAGNRVIYVPSAEVGHVVRDEQLRSRWLFKRAHGLGRGRVRLTQMFGGRNASRALMSLRVLVAGIQYYGLAPSAPRESQRTVERGSVFHYWRGQLREARVLASERRLQAKMAGMVSD